MHQKIECKSTYKKDYLRNFKAAGKMLLTLTQGLNRKTQASDLNSTSIFNGSGNCFSLSSSKAVLMDFSM